MVTKSFSFLGVVSLVSCSLIACVGVDDSTIDDGSPAEEALMIQPPARSPIPANVDTAVPTPEEYERCGGVIAIGCQDGYTCVDDPRDDCNPYKGDSDCVGICVPMQNAAP